MKITKNFNNLVEVDLAMENCKSIHMVIDFAVTSGLITGPKELHTFIGF